MNKIKLIGISAVSVFFLMFIYFVAISGHDIRIMDGNLTVSEMHIPELILFIYAIIGSLIGWFYSIKIALQNKHKWWAAFVLIFWPLSAIYLTICVR